MSKNSKTFIGILSFAPVILTIIIIAMIFNLVPQFIVWDKHEPDFYTVFTTISPLIVTAVICGLISLGLLIFFIIHMLNHKKMESVEKLIWILVFLFVGFIGYPIYWYMRIWKEDI